MNKLSADFQEKLNEYEQVFLASHNYSLYTRRAYLIDITQLLDFLASKGLTTLQDVSLRNLDAWLAKLDRKSLAGTTRRRKASSVKSFFDFLERSGYVSKNIAKRLIMPEVETKRRKRLSREEYQRLEAVVANKPKKAAIIQIFLQTGIRLSELVNLDLGDILRFPKTITSKPEDAGILSIRSGKRRKDRIVPLNEKACSALKIWLRERPKEIKTEAIITSKFRNSKNNGRITQGGIQKIVKKCFMEAKIHGASVHTLRHTCASWYLKNGAKLTSIRDLLGHTNIATTSIYLSEDEEQMIQDVQRFGL